jgi:tRNA dimethylallyltransferase
MRTSPLIVITGPTAVGKTKLAVALATSLNAEIINADSRQVYRKMDIGTGKDLDEYEIDGRIAPYHLINICEPGYRYNIKEYQQDFTVVYEALQEQGKAAILCGGSGLYIESALEGNPFAFVPVNPDLRDELKDESKSTLINLISEGIIDQLNISTNTTSKRLLRAVEISKYFKDHSPPKKEPQRRESVIFAIKLGRATILTRIITRLKYRLENGLVEEVEGLLSSGLTPEQLLYYGLEYRWVTMYILEEMTYDEMFERLNISIRQFAKRQMTWFRRMEKKGYDLIWLDGNKSTEELKNEVLGRLTQEEVG